MHWLVFAVLANVVANLSFKRGMTTAHDGLAATAPWTAKALQLLANPWLWLGGVSAVLLLGAFLMALRTVPVSVAYPVTTASAVLGIVGGGVLLLGETLSWTNALGTAFVVVGLILLLS
mgnify:FL=1